MAAIKNYVIVCDVDSRAGACTATYPASVRAWNGDRARMEARDNRWHQAGGKDICPEHWEGGWRFGRDGWTVG